jgi:hypothetical protein
VNYQHRRIFKTQLTGAATLRELLQTMFIAELLETRGRLWIVSPWVSNIVLIDNRTGNFDSLSPDWGRREVRLAEVLSALMARGSSVVLVTRGIDMNKAFVDAFEDQAMRMGVEDQLKIVLRRELHTKGIVLSRSLLLGSMNLTFFGIEINDESIEFCVEAEDVAQARLEFESYLEVER